MDSVVVDIPSILSAISQLSDKISQIPDEIPSYFQKRTAHAICVTLSYISGLSLSGACLSKAWKTVIVVTLLKKQPSSVCNYLPISLTSSVCKVLEILVRDSVTTHLLSLGLLYPSQHGFRAGCSTVTQLILASTDCFSAFNDCVQTEVVYIDFAKGFDVVCHRKLLLKLEAYGIFGALFGSLLMGRTFRVKVGNSLCEFRSTSSDVLQRSVLGPLLFLLVINDPSDSIHCTCKILADDVKISGPLR